MLQVRTGRCPVIERTYELQEYEDTGNGNPIQPLLQPM
jgi:hypothetical protein